MTHYTITIDNQTRAANLYLKEDSLGDMIGSDGQKYSLVMPDKNEKLPSNLPRDKGILMAWPVNPHNTGENGIKELLHDYGVIVTNKRVIA